MDRSFLSPNKADVLEAAAAGAFLSMLMQPKIGWKSAITIFTSGILTAYFFAGPLSFMFSHWTGADPIACLPISGFTVGFMGMYVCAAALALLTPFSRNPLGALARTWQAWQGQKPIGDDDADH